jgi:hypothetical protein
MLRQSIYDDLPETIQSAFSEQTLLSLREIARLLDMDRGTFSKLVANGNITGRLKGTGRRRRHWVFSIADVAGYLRSKQSVERRDEQILDLLAGQRSFKIGTMNVSIRPKRSKARSSLAKSNKPSGET